MSRAEPEPAPSLPSVRRAAREAVVDFFYNGWAFLGANVAVGMVLLAAFYGALYVSPWLLLLAGAVVVPVAGTMRMATRLRRDGHTDLGDFGEVRGHGRVLLVGLAELAILVVLAVDVAIGLASGSWFGVVLLAGAAYGFAAIWALSVSAWPVLLDPVRDGAPIRSRLRLATLVLFVHPWRVGGIALVSAIVVVVSTVLVAPILTIAVSFICLLGARAVLPLSDEVEARLLPPAG